MKRFILPVAVLLFIGLEACQKEIDWGTAGNSTGNVLYRIKSADGADTSQVDFFYDAAGRLIREKTTGVNGGVSMNNELIINRNASGVITTTVQKSPAFAALGVDSVVTVFYYNIAASRYRAASFVISLLGFAVTDSAVFTYDATGRISKDEHYLSTGALGVPLPAMLMLRNNYNYDAAGKNLINVSQEAAANPGDPLTQVLVQAYTYDAKTNPLILQNEAIILNRPNFFNAGNVAGLAVTDVTDPANNFSNTNLYFYNNRNRPDSCQSTYTPGGAVTSIKYYYR